MSILISAFPRGGSTFTLKAMTEYLESIYGKDNVNSINEPETDLPGCPPWSIEFSTRPFKEVIESYKNKEETFSPNLRELLETPTHNVILKTNYYTRVLNYVDLPDTIFYMFVVRCPYKWLNSNGNNRGILYYSLYDKVPNIALWEEELVDLWLEITEEIVIFIRKLPESQYVVLNYYEYVDNPQFLEDLVNRKLGFNGKMPEYNKKHYKRRKNTNQQWLDFPTFPKSKIIFYRTNEVILRMRQLGFDEKMVNDYLMRIESLKLQLH